MNNIHHNIPTPQNPELATTQGLLSYLTKRAVIQSKATQANHNLPYFNGQTPQEIAVDTLAILLLTPPDYLNKSYCQAAIRNTLTSCHRAVDKTTTNPDNIKLDNRSSEETKEHLESYVAEPAMDLGEAIDFERAILNLTNKVQVIFLSTLKGYTLSEIAASTNLNINTVATHLKEAIRQMQEVLV